MVIGNDYLQAINLDRCVSSLGMGVRHNMCVWAAACVYVCVNVKIFSI